MHPFITSQLAETRIRDIERDLVHATHRAEIRAARVTPPRLARPGRMAAAVARAISGWAGREAAHPASVAPAPAAPGG